MPLRGENASDERRSDFERRAMVDVARSPSPSSMPAGASMTTRSSTSTRRTSCPRLPDGALGRAPAALDGRGARLRDPGRGAPARGHGLHSLTNASTAPQARPGTRDPRRARRCRDGLVHHLQPQGGPPRRTATPDVKPRTDQNGARHPADRAGSSSTHAPYRSSAPSSRRTPTTARPPARWAGARPTPRSRRTNDVPPPQKTIRSSSPGARGLEHSGRGAARQLTGHQGRGGGPASPDAGQRAVPGSQRPRARHRVHAASRYDGARRSLQAHLRRPPDRDEERQAGSLRPLEEPVEVHRRGLGVSAPRRVPERHA